jgi:hypothetical protein
MLHPILICNSGIGFYPCELSNLKSVIFPSAMFIYWRELKKMLTVPVTCLRILERFVNDETAGTATVADVGPGAYGKVLLIPI